MSGSKVAIQGQVISNRKFRTRQGQEAVSVNMQDLIGEIEVVAWPDLYISTQELWKDGMFLEIHGRVRSRNDEIKFLSEEQVRYNKEATELRQSIKSGEKELLALDDKVAELERQIKEVLGEDAAELMDKINKLHREIDRRGDQIVDAESAIEEAAEVISWKILGIHKKPIIIFNFENYWNSMIEMYNNAKKSKFGDKNLQSVCKIVKTFEEFSLLFK